MKKYNPLQEKAKENGIYLSIENIRNRLRYGWSHEEIVTIPKGAVKCIFRHRKYKKELKKD